MTSQFLRKITVKSIGCNANVGKDKAVDLCEVWGIVTSLTPGTSALGEYVRLNGNFGAYNLQDDREFNSNHFHRSSSRNASLASSRVNP